MELNVNMHCEACAEQLKKKILKMKGNDKNNSHSVKNVTERRASSDVTV